MSKRFVDDPKATGTLVTVPDPEARLAPYRLTVVDGPDCGLTLELGPTVTNVGTAPGSEVLLTDPVVSRNHLALKVGTLGCEIQDLGSTNGSYLDGVRFDRIVITREATVTIGQTAIRVARRTAAHRMRANTPAPLSILEPEDLVDLVAHGIAEEDARDQLAFLAHPPPPLLLLRAATLGDGIMRISPERHEALRARWAEGAAAGRLGKFVPASGGATRMFDALMTLWAEGDMPEETLRARAGVGETWSKQALDFHAQRTAFAFWPDVAEVLAARGIDVDAVTPHQLAAAVLDRQGLDFARCPKGLIRFHASEGTGTPLEAHLTEAVETVRDANGRCRIHFTVAEAHLDLCRDVVREAVVRLGVDGISLAASMSTQAPSTDALAVAADGRPFRTEDGLLFRPGGHGALLTNLQACMLDVAHVKNVDNVLPHGAPERAIELATTQLLFGLALELDGEIRRHTLALEGGTPDAAAIDAALVFLARELGATPVGELETPSERTRWALDHLRRPLRVCGMVPNQGQAGGGPFWTVNSAGEPSLQIVEAAQVAKMPEQRAILGTATHFNPVELVCVLRDAHGRPHDLARWVDPATSFVVEKSFGGRRLRSIERPGLWNGGMARWNTVFVEIPKECFAPVKTVLDLLGPAHRGP